MTRSFLFFALASALAAPALAQTGTPTVAPVGSPAEPHAVPFGSSANTLELEVAAPDGAATGYEVAVASAPAWLRFHADHADTEAGEGGDPVARLVFDVLLSAPVGESAEIAVEVRAGGAVVASHVVRLLVEAPSEFALATPYPNPARGTVTIPFEVPKAGRVRVSAFDVLGREVAVLVDGERGPGGYEARLDAGALSAGTYVVRMTAGSGREVRVRRLTVVR